MDGREERMAGGVSVKYPTPKGEHPKRRRKWLFRIVPVLVMLAAPIIAEGGLRLFGVGAPTDFFIRQGDYWFANEKFAQQFFGPRATSRPVYFRVPVQKGPDTVRIVVLGESAAMGTPDPGFSFGRVLQVILEQRLGRDASPYLAGKKIELVNAAMRGIDSHVVRRIAKDGARVQPDLFIVYMGNNEVIGLHGPEPGCSRFSQSPWVIRAGQFLKSTRLGQAFRKLARGDARPPAQDMEFFRKHRLRPDDWRREAVRRNFAANLEDICRLGPRVIVSTVPVNMKDFPPLGSLEGELNAEEQFRLAQKFLAAGETNQARAHYERAMDYDALQFRADTKLNERIRAVAAKFPKDRLTLVDGVSAFADEDGGIPGGKLFRDHVHPTFEGDYLLAKTLLSAVEAALNGSTESRPTNETPSREECAKLLGYTEWHDAQIQLAIVGLTSRPPYHDQLDYRERQAKAENEARERLVKLGVPEVEAALQISLAAVKRRPDDWMLHHNCVQLYQALGRPAGAVKHLEQVVQIFPHVASFQILLGEALAAAGRRDAAIYHYEKAVKLDPADERAREGLAQLRQRAPRQ